MKQLRVPGSPVFARITAVVAILLASACQSAAPPPSPTVAPVAAKPTVPAAAPPVAAPPAAPSVAASPVAQPVPSASTVAGPTFNQQAVADFYKGKTVRLIVGFGAGGGYDTYTRLLGKYFSKYIPGNPNVIVENLPGAGSKLAFSQVANSFPKDGTIIGTGDGGLAESQILSPADFDFEFGKLQFIGAPSIFEYLLFITKAASARTGVTAFKDILGPNSKQLVLGATGTGLDYVSQTLMKEVLGANLKLVGGYAGSAAIRLAMESGEVDGYTNGWDSISATNNADIMNGNWLLLGQLTQKPIAVLPQKLANIPLVADLAKTPEDKQLFIQGAVLPQFFGRPYVMAPGVPADRVAAIRDAFLKTLSDPDLRADAQKANLEIQPVSGQEITSVVTEFVAMPASLKQRLKTILKF